MRRFVTTNRLRRAAALCGLTLCACTLPATATAEDTARIDVADPRAVTVVGDFESLSNLVATLCQRANVELRGYAAPDRPVTVDQRSRPLRDVLERLLVRENYLLGVRTPANDGETAGASQLDVAWIRVTGSRASGAGAAGLTVPARFGRTEFKREDPIEADRAHAAVAERLLSDEAGVRAFLDADAGDLARSLGQYPHIDVLLRKIRSEQEHAEVRDQLDAVLAALAGAQENSAATGR